MDTRDFVLYSDFDVALQHHNSKGAPVTSPFLDESSRYILFQHVPLLEHLLELYSPRHRRFVEARAYRYDVEVAKGGAAWLMN